MVITKETRVADIIREYGAKAVTVEWAARIHRVPLDKFLDILHRAVPSANEETQPGKRARRS